MRSIFQYCGNKEHVTQMNLTDGATMACFLPALSVELGMHPVFEPLFEGVCLMGDVIAISRRLHTIDSTGRAIVADLNSASPLTYGEKPA